MASFWIPSIFSYSHSVFSSVLFSRALSFAIHEQHLPLSPLLRCRRVLAVPIANGTAGLLTWAKPVTWAFYTLHCTLTTVPSEHCENAACATE